MDRPRASGRGRVGACFLELTRLDGASSFGGAATAAERDGGSGTEGGRRGGERECLYIWRQAGPHRGGHRRAGGARSAHEKACMGICVEGVRVRGDGAMRRRGDGERWGCRRDEVSGESVRPAGEGERVECGQATASSATDWDRSVPHSSGKQSSKFLYHDEWFECENVAHLRQAIK